MPPFRRIQARLALAIGLTALIPVVAAVMLAESLVRQSSERFFVPEIRQHLDRGLATYRELAHELKLRLRQTALAYSSDRELNELLSEPERGRIEQRLEALRNSTPEAVEMRVVDSTGSVLAAVGQPSGDEGVLPLSTSNPMSGGYELSVRFEVARERLERFEAAGEFLEAYDTLMQRRVSDERTYVIAFAVLLGFTIIAAVAVGVALARGVVRRVQHLADATARVTAGDFSARVFDGGSDELGQLARGFNRMLDEIDDNRERIDYLSRVASWQEMARRLAHEIKNPLTPILLAVQEVHQRLTGAGGAQDELLDTAREIVESEVASLRRLVGEFSDFARLPESAVESVDLFEFLREIERQADITQAFAAAAEGMDCRVNFEIPEVSAPVQLDPIMFRRAIINLIENGVQAAATTGLPVRVSVSGETTPAGFAVAVEDSGPGIEPALRNQVFEPYFTTKSNGTGLGLAIVKKIVLDHRASVSVATSRYGGARFRIGLPRDVSQP